MSAWGYGAGLVRALEIFLRDFEGQLNHDVLLSGGYYYNTLVLKATEILVASVKVFGAQKLISRSNERFEHLSNRSVTRSQIP